VTRTITQVADASAAPATPSLQRLELEDARWAAFVAGSAAATPFHDPVWARLLADTYGFPAFALALTGAGGEIVAGAPFLAVRSLRGRRSWISLPYTDECPVLAADPRAEGELHAALATMAGAPRIELRAEVAALGWRRDAGAVIHVAELEADAQAVRKRFSKSQVVRNINRAEREGVSVRAATTAADLDAFVALHLRTRRRQGVPMQPRRFFDLIWSRFIEPGKGSILLAEHGGRDIATALFLTGNGTTIYKFGASDPDGWPLRPNHAIFWRAIQESCARGDRWFDFGRTDLDNPGLRAFKSGWGATERPLVYSSAEPGDAHQGLAGRALERSIQRGPEWLGRVLGERLYRYAAAR
jgi:CelD/BcsL family acetyltransferase involved in cellulose biosynthesis